MLARFSVWLEDKTLKRLEEIGKLEDRPIGWLVRKAVEEFVKNYKHEKK
jgi:predicted transcriptional regulator